MCSERNDMVLATVNRLAPAELAAWLGDAFEHSPWVIEAAALRRPFSSIAAFHDACVEAIAAASEGRRIALVRAHPDLAGKAARAGTLTDLSTREQAGAGLNRLSDAQYARFAALNDAYRARFGWPFVICVHGRTAAEVLDAFEWRLGGSQTRELAIALDEIGAIGRLRLTALLARPEPAVLGECA